MSRAGFHNFSKDIKMRYKTTNQKRSIVEVTRKNSEEMIVKTFLVKEFAENVSINNNSEVIRSGKVTTEETLISEEIVTKEYFKKYILPQLTAI
jgi:hypothetical protein